MLIWFAVLSVLLVAIVFKSPGIDYRTVIVGAVLPIGEGLTGGPKVLHSVVGAVVVLGVLMLATRRQRLLRRRLLGIPIGMMAHLVLEVVGIAVGVWAWRWFGLDDPVKRQRFWSDGRLDVPA